MAGDISELDGLSNVAGFCDHESRELELEIERMGIVLGIDWENEAQVSALAREALNHSQEAVASYEHGHDDYQKKAKATLFALSYMMLNIMAKSADKGIHTHGGKAWKAFSRALMKEQGIPILDSADPTLP